MSHTYYRNKESKTEARYTDTAPHRSSPKGEGQAFKVAAQQEATQAMASYEVATGTICQKLKI